MAGVARLGDSLQGMTTGEHGGHYPNGSPAHPTPCTITGNISGNCSDFFFVDGQPVALVGSVTDEDDCCNPGNGAVAAGSAFFFIGGRAVARKGDKINPHNGEANITGGSTTMFVNG